MSVVFKIGITKNKNQEIQEVKEINVSAGKGIIGDRYYCEHNEDCNQLTLIESENIDYYNEKFNLKIPYLSFRRNIVTRNINSFYLIYISSHWHLTSSVISIPLIIKIIRLINHLSPSVINFKAKVISSLTFY
mgnify:CR=1 FL=1